MTTSATREANLSSNPSTEQSGAAPSRQPARPPHTPRLIGAKAAAVAAQLSSEEFTITRWALEELFDPASGQGAPIPAEWRVTLLSSSERRRLPAHEQQDYLARIDARKRWAKTVFLRIAVWGARKLPRGEWKFEEALVRAWGSSLRGFPAAGAARGARS